MTANQGSRVLRAQKTLDRAWRDLDRTVAVVFPVGAQVRVMLGGHVVDGTVEATHSPDHWTGIEAGYVYITNNATGKRRKFHAPSTIENGLVLVLNR